MVKVTNLYRMLGTRIKYWFRCQVQEGNTIISVQQEPWTVPCLIFLCEYLQQDICSRVPAKKSYSAATMILQCSIFTDPLSFPAFCRVARIQGFAAPLPLKSLHKNIVKLKSRVQPRSAKMIFFPNLQQVLPVG